MQLPIAKQNDNATHFRFKYMMLRMGTSLIVTVMFVMTLQGTTAFAPGVFPTISSNYHKYNNKFFNPIDSKRKSHANSSSSMSLIRNEEYKFSQRMSQYDRKTSMLMSLSIVAGCRRLSFLLISIALVNTFRTVVMKVCFDVLLP